MACTIHDTDASARDESTHIRIFLILIFVAYFVLFLATPVPFEVHSAPTPRTEERDSMSIHRPPTHVPREVTTTHTR
jgi:hypothetical protein